MPGPGGKVCGYITAHLLATVWQQLCQFAEVHVLVKRNKAEMMRVNREAAGCKMGGVFTHQVNLATQQMSVDEL